MSFGKCTVLGMALLITVVAIGRPEEPEIDVKAKVDRTFVKELDLTGDGKKDRLVLHIWGEDFLHPLRRTTSIESQGRQIFHHESNDASFDKYFGQMTCFDGYVSCKYDFYFRFVPSFMLPGKVSFETNDFDLFDPWHNFYVGSEIRPARDYLKKVHRLSDEKIEEVIRHMVDFIKSGKAVGFRISPHPVAGPPTLIYVDEVKDFVPVHIP